MVTWVVVVACCVGMLMPATATRSGPGRPSTAMAASSHRIGVHALTPFRLPLAGQPRITRGFDLPPQPWLPGHRGVDLGGQPGQQVLAAGSGVVHFAGAVAGVGVVSIAHADGLLTTYQPIQPSVQEGQAVLAGQSLGLLEAGHPGCSAQACLHWGARLGETYIDPLSLLGPVRVRLLPLGSAVR